MGCFGLFQNKLFWLFRFYAKTGTFDVSIEPKQTEDQLKQFNPLSYGGGAIGPPFFEGLLLKYHPKSQKIMYSSPSMSTTYFFLILFDTVFLYQMTIYVFLKRFCKPSQKMGVLSAPGHMESTLSVHNTTSDLSYGQGPYGPHWRGKIYRGSYTSTT